MSLATPALEALLRATLPAQEWALIFDVPNATGGMASRRADAMAMSLWHSRGIELHGFELKISRSDWLRERKDPAKADALAVYCDRWWLVTAPGIVKPDELPAPWGHYEVVEVPGTGNERAHWDRLVVRKKPAKLKPKPYTRQFLAGLLRSAQDNSPGSEQISEAVANASYKAREVYQEKLNENQRQLLEAKQNVRNEIREFEKASGIEINQWHHGNVGHALRLFMSGMRGNLINHSGIDAALHSLQEVVLQLELARTQYKAVHAQLHPAPEKEETPT